MISVVVRLYNDVLHIYNCLVGCYKMADEIVVLEGAYDIFMQRGSSYYKERRSSDGSVEEVKRFILNNDIDGKVRFVHCSGKDHQDMINMFWSNTAVGVGDYVLVVDSDEIYRQEDAVKIREFITTNNPKSNFGVFAYNLVGIDRYRSDSGVFGIGGYVGIFGEFDTDRHTKPCGVVEVIPDVCCFHYSLLKPTIHLENKLLLHPEIKNHWKLVDGKPVFVDGTDILVYGGALPVGYSRECGVSYKKSFLYNGGDIL